MIQIKASIPEETKYPAMSRASFLTSMPFLAALGTTLSFFAFTGNDYLAHLLRIGVYLRQHHDYSPAESQDGLGLAMVRSELGLTGDHGFPVTCTE